MRLVYTPEDGEKREFSFVPSKLMSPEAEAIEDVGGQAWDSFDEFGVKFMKGNRRAYRAALWVLLRREALATGAKAPRFQDLTVRVDEIEVEFEDDEKMRIREAVAADPDMDPDQREHLLAAMDADAIRDLNAAIDVPKGEPTGSEPPSGRTATDSAAASTDSP